MAEEGLRPGERPLSRRRFLLRLGVALNVVAASLMAVPIVGYVLSSMRPRRSQAWISIARRCWNRSMLQR